MRKRTIILISVALVVAFSTAVYYGLRHSRGVPVAVEVTKRATLEVPFIDREIDLAEGISLDVWNSIAPTEVELTYQVMVLPWPKGLASPITVKAFHNGENMYFYIEWEDDTENRSLGINEFPDATAIMFPLDEKVQPSTIMMGFTGRSNIWQWKASQDREYWSKELPEAETYSDFYYPFEGRELFVVSKVVAASAANDLMAIGVGTVTSKEAQNVQGRGFWNGGTWRVVFKRSLKPVDPEVDAVFNPGVRKLCAFGVWNGANGDRGGRKSISDWVELVLE
ncbi:MAG: ethylbenzene dehydrogenase-related protein [bacterium]